MSRIALRLIFALFLISLALSSPAAADSLASLMGWPFNTADTPGLTYATGTVRGVDPIPRRINFIQYPVLGFPALLTEEDELQVFVVYQDGEAFLDPAEWRVSLVSGFASPADAYTWVGDAVRQRIDLEVDAVEYDDAAQIYHLTCSTPADVPIDLYALEVETTAFFDIQPAAVKIAESFDDGFTFAHLTDLQIGDPLANDEANELNSGAYPGCGLGDRPLTLFAQEIQGELSRRRPDFAILTGNLVFGLDQDAENEAILPVLQNSQTPIFLVPGQRDGYSRLTGPQIDCDGLEHFTRLYGPAYYSFNVGSLHFLAVNSYDGAARRRESKYQVLDSAVDNRGGFVTQPQLDWLAADLEQADSEGRSSLIFMHHDPRGPYVANDPYPTAPYLPAELEYWNFESAAWDSDPLDDIENETTTDNTGVALLRLALEHRVSHLLIGHAGVNAVWHFGAGDAITDRFGSPVGGLLATRALTIVQTTTASGTLGEAAEETDANGYRSLEATAGQVTNINYIKTTNQTVPTVPAGNFWVEEFNNDGTFDHVQIVVHNGLPAASPVTLEFYLTANPAGYEILREDTQTPMAISQVGLGENGEAVLYLQTTVDAPDAAAATFPVAAGQEAKLAFTARRNYTNQPPTASFTATLTDEENVWCFDGVASTDPENETLVYHWNFGDGETTIGRTVYHQYRKGGQLLASLTVLDGSAGQDTTAMLLDIGDGCWDCDHDDDADDECGGCGMSESSGDAGMTLLLLLATAALLGSLARRARTRG